ncbi:FecR family protein [Plebeiibacterium marinum]|uniref:FecR domain-containing protein n=1 Tax=Plebeiibacterium marinum TaxID=2992111 RepID=A0AAE3SJU3_9BACT|nr:FecR domain-containing protein [Plebeiobacterium marinum]MCW3804745.1 FecR domain-containing protein [Plebeiobacterium marinum]
MTELIRKYLENIATEEERRELLEWLRDGKHYAEFCKVKKSWKNNLKNENINPVTEKGLVNFQSFMLNDTVAQTNKIIKLKSFYKYAAVVLLFIISGGGFYFSKYINNEPLYTKIAADRGSVATVTLPDSSKVWLNSGSTLEYSNGFGNSQRLLKLNGQAYFEVVKNKKVPFIVRSRDINVKVLGTRFTVDAYDNAVQASVVLEEGSVEMTPSRHPKQKMFLKPGEKIVYDSETEKAKRTNVRAERYSSWRNGILNFYNTPMRDVVRKLSNRYNFEFGLDQALEDMEVTFTVNQEDLPSVLDLLTTITPVNIVSKGDSILIKPYTK